MLRSEGAVRSADVIDGGVVVRCGDGEIELHPLWLRERSCSADAVDQVNRQRLHEPADLGGDLAVVEVGVIDGRDLSVTFNDGHQMSLPLASLGGMADEDPPGPVPWRAASTDVPVFDYSMIARGDRPEVRAALTAFFELGFFVLTGTPAVPGALREITSHFGHISPTNFGELFNVRTEPVPVDLAYTPVALSAHTDQPYRAPVPGLQFLHTIANGAPGGASTIVDGLAAVNDLAVVDPEAHEVLCTLPVEFRYDVGTDVKVDRSPIIERAADGSLRQLRFSPRLDFAPLTDRSTLEIYYRGRRWLADALNDPCRQLGYRMEAGDTLVVDNHRVLHGRTSFDPMQGHRRLQGCYIDHDGPITQWILANRNESSG